MKNDFSVTVLMSAYNAEKYVCKTIESVLKQTFSDFKFLIIENGSKDATRTLLHEFEERDTRIEVIYLSENIGLSGALNLGLSKISSHWVARIDADDLWYPQKLERQMNFLFSNDNYSLLASWVDYININGDVIGTSKEDLISWEAVEERYKRNKAVVFCHSSIVFDKDVVLKVGGYHSQFWPAEDADLWNRVIECEKKMHIYPEVLTLYRIYDGGNSIMKLRDMNEHFRYVKHCMRARRIGRVEPTFEEYLSTEKKISRNFKNYRNDLYMYYYKNGVISYSKHERCKFLIHMLIASCIHPARIFSTILKKKIK